MKLASVNFTIKQWIQMYKKSGSIKFDYPIQRDDNQWSIEQKSLFIDSIINEFPIPHMYAVGNEGTIINRHGKEAKGTIYSFVDGKQRFTTFLSFINNEFALSEGTQYVVDGEVYNLEGLTFDQLDEEVKDAINNRNLNIYKIEDATDEEIEEIFYRLNNGTALNNAQKMKANMGIKTANKMNEIKKHSFFELALTNATRKKAEDEKIIAQTVMLLDKGNEIQSFSSNHVLAYTSEFDASKLEVVENAMETISGVLDVAQERKDGVMKPLHIVMLLASMIEKGLETQPDVFKQWYEQEFKSMVTNPDSEYREFCGAGSVKKDKVLSRFTIVKESIDMFLNDLK